MFCICHSLHVSSCLADCCVCYITHAFETPYGSPHPSCFECMFACFVLSVAGIHLTVPVFPNLFSSQTPALVCSEAFSVFLHKHCPVVAETFSPTPWCWGGRLQTLVCALIKSRPPVTYRNELIRTVDGGQISLDWVDNQASTAYPESSTRPTVLILPGLTGNSQQTYVLHAITQASRHGYRCVVFNNRGFGGEELLVSTMITQ